MLDILTITSPIYIVILFGFFMTRIGIFNKTDMRVFGKFVIHLALPALLFRALAERQFGEIFNVSYLLAYLTGTLLVIGLGVFWGHRFAGLNPTTNTFFVLGMACSNSGFVGYPILLLTLAPVAGVALALNLIVEVLCVIPLMLFLAESTRGHSGRWRTLGQSFLKLASNPLIIGMLAGLTASVFGWTLPAPVARVVELLAAASGALSLIVIGGTLVDLPLHGLGKRVIPIVIGKLMVHPLLVLLTVITLPLLGLPEIDTSLRMAVVLTAAMPMLSTYPTLAQAYGQEDFSAVALLITTFTSFFTLNALLYALKHIPAFG